MAFQIPSFQEIRSRYLQAVVNQWPDAAIGPDSDHFVRANAIAAVAEGIFAHQAWVYRQAFPDLADADLMEKMANQRGIVRKSAALASGTLRLSGTAGTAVGVGVQVLTAQGVYYATTAAGVIDGGGTLDLPVAALVAGAAGNQSGATPVTVNAPPAGVAALASLLTMTGGADAESDDSLLARLLLWLSEEAQGGNKVDYQRWALGVAGVVRAFVFDVRRGAGTVDVVPMPESGLPDAPLLAAVQAVLDVRRPVGLRPVSPVLALAPTPVVVDVTAALTLAPGYTLAALLAPLTQAIDAVFAALAPGDTLVRNELITAVMNVAGVTDVTLASPGGNVTSSVNASALELVTRGVLALS